VAEGLKRKRSGWWLWLLVAVAVVGGGVVWKRRRPTNAPGVRAWLVRRGSVRDLVSSVSTGRIAARQEATLRAEIAGRVVRLHHRRGDRVTAGEPLVSYDTADLRERLRAAETGVTVAGAQRAQAEASARLAQRNAARAGQLSARGATPIAEAETLQGQAEVARQAVLAAEAARTQGLANVAVARGVMGRSVVRAPFSGLVLTTSVEEGEVTAPGSALLSMADVSSLHLDTDVDEADFGRVSVGLAAEVSLDAFPGDRIVGTVNEIAPSVTSDARGNRSIAIRVALPSDPRLRVGMSADADVIAATRSDVIFVPPIAVVGRGTDRAVYTISGGVAHRRVVRVGIATWESVEVLDGLRPGEQVILNANVEGLADGSAVRVLSVDRPGAPPR
jgi:RND family efflux transporter MFP subunit